MVINALFMESICKIKESLMRLPAHSEEELVIFISEGNCKASTEWHSDQREKSKCYGKSIFICSLGLMLPCHLWKILDNLINVFSSRL